VAGREARTPAHATGRLATKTSPPISSTLPIASTTPRSGRHSNRSEIPAKNSTAAKKTVDRMYLSSLVLAAVPSS
jgi:hypothetical protein